MRLYTQMGDIWSRGSLFAEWIETDEYNPRKASGHLLLQAKNGSGTDYPGWRMQWCAPALQSSPAMHGYVLPLKKWPGDYVVHRTGGVGHCGDQGLHPARGDYRVYLQVPVEENRKRATRELGREGIQSGMSDWLLRIGRRHAIFDCSRFGASGIFLTSASRRLQKPGLGHQPNHRPAGQSSNPAAKRATRRDNRAR